MIEDFNNNEKEGINFKSLGLKIFFSLTLVVICYNLFFSINSNSTNLIGVEKKFQPNRREVAPGAGSNFPSIGLKKNFIARNLFGGCSSKT